MKAGTVVTHVALTDKFTVKGKPLNRNLFDGKESLPGLKMVLCQYGVACRAPQPIGSFLIPFTHCATIAYDEDTK